MAKTIILLRNVHLSAQFGGIEHGEKTGDLKKGSTVELESDALADKLIAQGLAAACKVEGKKKAN